MALSIITTYTGDRDDIKKMLFSLKILKNYEPEIIIINQTSTELKFKNDYNLNVIEYITHGLIPLSTARNIGASLATNDYLFFIDDDAEFLANSENIFELFRLLKQKCYDVIILNRGHYEKNKFVSHWPNNKMSYTNFSNFLIEWCLIIKKDIFFDLGQFVSLGVGQPHSGQCGEGFVLGTKILTAKCKIRLFGEICVAHPKLDLSNKSTKMVLGYMYGTGYSIGISLKYFPFVWKIYWVLRGIFAPIFDMIINKESLMCCYIRLVGLFDGLFNKKPREIDWLNKFVK